MNPERRELFRLALLRVLDANHTRFGLGLPALGHLAGSFGFPTPSDSELERELQYLEDKAQITPVLKGISPENRAWRITAAGRDYLAEAGDEE
jgi:hypothetical protein